MLKASVNAGAFFLSKKHVIMQLALYGRKFCNAGNSERLDRYGYLSRGPAAHKTEILGVPVAGLDGGKLNRVHNETKA